MIHTNHTPNLTSTSNHTPALTSNETKIRLTAAAVLILILSYLITANIYIIGFILIDFALRSSPDLARYSPLSNLSGRIAKTLKLPAKPVYLPPKRFAARIGLLFIITILIVHANEPTNITLSAIIALFAALESLAGFCAGCWIYTAFTRLRTNH